MRRFFIFHIAIGFLLLGCRHRPKENLLWPSDLPGSFSTSGQVPLGAKWWQSFDDVALNSLVEQGLSNNFSIRAAWERFTQAEQLAIKTGASVYPAVSYQGVGARQRNETAQQTIYSTQYQVGLAAGYELDLWGKIDSARKAAQLDASAAQEEVHAAAISLTASIARIWFELVESRLQEQLIASQIKTNQDILEVVTLQFRQGLVGASNVYRQRQLVQATEGQLIAAKEKTTLLAHQLAILLGKTPAVWQPPDSARLPDLGALPETGVPAKTLLCRPDIASAAKQVAAADFRAYAAMTDQFPQFSLTGAVQTNAARPADLFENWLSRLAADVSGPLFDAGARAAETRRQKAVFAERLNLFAQKVLTAVGEMEDALQQEKYGYERLDNLRRQLESAKMVYLRAKDSYLKGQLDYLRVLDALVSQQALERSELTARRQLLDYRIGLCRALAGRLPIERGDQ